MQLSSKILFKVITLKTKTLPVDKALIYVYERVSHEKPGDAYCTVFLKNLYTFFIKFYEQMFRSFLNTYLEKFIIVPK